MANGKLSIRKIKDEIEIYVEDRNGHHARVLLNFNYVFEGIKRLRETPIVGIYLNEEDFKCHQQNQHIINIICVVPSLNIQNNNLYKKLKVLLGDQLIGDFNIRTLKMVSKTSQIFFVSCKQETCTISGIWIDVAIIADSNITEEWEQFLERKIKACDGILLNMK